MLTTGTTEATDADPTVTTTTPDGGNSTSTYPPFSQASMTVETHAVPSTDDEETTTTTSAKLGTPTTATTATSTNTESTEATPPDACKENASCMACLVADCCWLVQPLAMSTQCLPTDFAELRGYECALGCEPGDLGKRQEATSFCTPADQCGVLAEPQVDSPTGAGVAAGQSGGVNVGIIAGVGAAAVAVVGILALLLIIRRVKAAKKVPAAATPSHRAAPQAHSASRRGVRRADSSRHSVSRRASNRHGVGNGPPQQGYISATAPLDFGHTARHGTYESPIAPFSTSLTHSAPYESVSAPLSPTGTQLVRQPVRPPGPPPTTM